MERAKAPGLKWRSRKSGIPIPYWVASEAAVKAGYSPKSVRLSYSAEAALIARCHRLQAEMMQWLSGNKGNAQPFDGTFGSLFRLYQTDPESKFHKLKPSSRHPYEVYLRKLEGHIGEVLLSTCDGRDLNRWFAIWSTPDKPGGRRKVAAARMAVCVIKAALSFGIMCRKPGCVEFRTILDHMAFESPKPRTAAPTAAEVEAVRRAAHAAGAPERALLYSLQFETTLRLWDVAGEWLPLSDPRPSAVLGAKRKWIGLTWAHIDADMVLRMTPEKTADTSEARVVIDLKECPMVLDELAHVPESKRTGPLIVDPKTGLPYIHRTLCDLWRKDATTAGIPKSVWNRDLRAGGITEARLAGAPTDDVSKVAGHSDKRTTARVYDRAHLEAARRVAKARVGQRGGNDAGT